MPGLAKVFWLIAEFWLPFVEMGEERVGPERLKEGIELMVQGLKPYMTDEALAELGSVSQKLYTRGEES